MNKPAKDLHLSTADHQKVGFHPWLNIRSARWLRFESAPTYLKAYNSVSAARHNLASYFEFYNARRPHQSHDGRTPDMIYFAALPAMKEAA